MICSKISHKAGPLDPDLLETGKALGLSPVLMGILKRRNLTDPEAIRTFLDGSPEPFHDPYGLLHMERAVTRICEALSKEEKITIYGDYDVDGTSASSLLFLFLTKNLGAKAAVYIPRRDTEGYGLNLEALEKIYAGGSTLVITVDTGISGADVIKKAPTGLDVIITDHHLAPQELPPAYTVVNPNQPGDSYPEKGICGCGVAFKLCQALWQHFHPESALWTDLIELAAVATVADVVPLVGENREIVRRGLKKIANTSLVGLRALIQSATREGSPITSDTIGFGIGPRINAAGRLDDAMLAVKLLITSDSEEAKTLSRELNDLNAKRQEISQRIFEEAEAMLTASGKVPTWGIVLAKEGWHPGVIGIVASRLTEKYHEPTILMSIKDGIAKGSCRSIPPVHLYHALEACRLALIQFGGHAQAAGLTMEADKVDELRHLFTETVKTALHGEIYEPEVEPDYFIPEGEAVTEKIVHELERLQPFGQNNPAPILGFERAVITGVRTMGKDGSHLRLDLSSGGYGYKGLLWQEGPRSHYFYEGEEAAMAFVPRLNTFRGVTTVDLEVKAVDTAQTIVDWRHSNLSKEAILNTILQKEEKTVLYKQESETELSFPPGVDVLPYGAPLPSGVKTVIFYDAGAFALMDEAHFPLKGAGVLHLLYHRDEMVAARQALLASYPDVMGLRHCYAHIRSVLNSRPYATKQDLLGSTREGYRITERVLKLFFDLHFFLEKDGTIVPRQVQPIDMAENPAYQEFCAERDRKEKRLTAAWQMKAAAIAALWNN